MKSSLLQSFRNGSVPLVLLLSGLAVAGCSSSKQRAVGGRATADADTLRILAYNIHHGEGMDEAIRMDRIAALINELKPDLVALQEVDSVVDRTGGVDQARVLAELTGLEPVFGEFMPYQGGKYGMAVLSRWPVLSSENIRLPDGEEPRSSVAVTVRSPDTGRKIVFAGIHFYRTEEERLAQARTLDAHLAGRIGPVILAGDFNSTPGSAVMEYLDDTYSILDKGARHNTFPSFEPVREIDFVLIRDDAGFSVLSHDVLHEPVMSDHAPITATVLLHAIAN